MKTTVSVYDFRDTFQQIRPNNFSYEGLTILFDYFEELEEACGQEIELDVIAICRDYSEDTPQEIADNYGIDISECEDDDEIMQQVKDFLETETVMIGVTDAGTIVYATF